MHRNDRGSPIVIVLALILTAALIGAWAHWLRSDPELLQNTPWLIFTWLLVVESVFLLITRAMREHSGRR